MVNSLLLASVLGTGPVRASQAMVSSPEPFATQVGVEIMKRGGNAFDAATAVGFAIAVTYPVAGNIGGGGFAVGTTRKGEKFALDFRETAPAGASRTMYLGPDGEVVKGRSTDTHLAVGVPGSVDGLLSLHAKYGKLSRAEVMAPAIKLASEGFVVSESLTRSLESYAGMLKPFSSTAAVFYPGGKPAATGSVLKQADLGRTLSLVSRQGRDGFYKGSVARAIASDMKANGGLITEADLAGYRSKWRKPVVFDLQGKTVVTMSLPSSGGVTLAQVSSFLDWNRLREAPHNSWWSIHHVTEALRLGFEDRNRYLGDPDFVEVPLDRLLSSSYLRSRKKLMPEMKAGKSSADSIGGVPESMETTHYCVVDSEGNVCAVTTTLNGGYGMGAVVPGAGFLLNNEMDDFTSKPGSPNMFGLVQGEANAIAPGKRMLSSMTPTILLKDGKFWMTVGSPGGPTIITTVLQTILNCEVWEMDIREAIEAPRFHHQHLPDQVVVEPGITDHARSGLEALGYDLNPFQRWGEAAGIMREPDGTLSGWFDSRGDGLAAGY